MKVEVKIDGLQSLKARMAGHAKQIPYAASRAINTVAFGVAKETKRQMEVVFDRPTAYALRGIQVLKKASKVSLMAEVGISPGAAGKGTPWENVLSHHFTGGQATKTRFEKALFRAGILPGGMEAVPAANSWAVKLDGHGNVPAGFMVQLLSYFRAMGEQGYRANMTDKRRAKIEKRGKSSQGFATINGVTYFVSRRQGQTKHLARGIWAKRGTHGSDVAPVFLFVDRATYRRRIDLPAIANQVIATQWPAAFELELDQAMRNAK